MADQKEWNWNDQPEYIPPSQASWGLLNQYGSNIGGLNNLAGYGDYQSGMGGMGRGMSGMAGLLSGGAPGMSPTAGYNQAWGGGMNALAGPGGASMWGVNPQGMKDWAANFMRGGGEAADKYETAATKNLQNTGKYAYNQLKAQGGGAGRLGSTVMGVDTADLAGKYGAARADIGATAAGMKEQNLMNRTGTAMGVLGNMAGLAAQERGQNIGGYGQMAGLEQAQQGLAQQGYGQQLGGYGALAGLYGQQAGMGQSQQQLAMLQQAQQQQQLLQQLGMQYGFEQSPYNYQNQQFQNKQQQRQVDQMTAGGDFGNVMGILGGLAQGAAPFIP